MSRSGIMVRDSNPLKKFYCFEDFKNLLTMDTKSFKKLMLFTDISIGDAEGLIFQFSAVDEETGNKYPLYESETHPIFSSNGNIVKIHTNNTYDGAVAKRYYTLTDDEDQNTLIDINVEGISKIAIDVKATDQGATIGYVTGGNNAQDDIEVWETVTDGCFKVTIDGEDYNFLIDFSAGAFEDIDDVAEYIEEHIRAKTGGEETVAYETDKFVIYSGFIGEESEVSLLEPCDDEDILDQVQTAGYLVSGEDTEDDIDVWKEVADGEFKITIDGVAYDIIGLDFSGITSLSDIANIIQAGIRSETDGNETVIIEEGAFKIISGTRGKDSQVSVTSAVTLGEGTDISGATTTESNYLDANTTNGTAVAGTNGTDLSAPDWLDLDDTNATATAGTGEAGIITGTFNLV